MVRIYISSTYSDLQSSREAVYRVLRQMGHDAIAMEDYVATDKRPLDKCLADVARCDIYIGIFAWRYGYMPPDQEQSITELEFREAVRTGKPCLLFLLDEDTPWPRSQIDRDSSRIEALRAELSRDYTVTFFQTADELAASVSIAVGEALKEISLEKVQLPRLERARAQEVHYHYDYIPLGPVDADTLAEAEQRLAEMPLDDVPDTAPLPQGSVPPLRKNPLFKGRKAEFQALAKVLKADEADLEGQTPPVIVTGIGGIGKSQLASEFVHRYGQYFLGGVFWLSFAVPSAVAAEVANCGEPGNMDLWAPNFDDLHPDAQKRQELKVRLVKSAWQSKLPRLLIFDNCEEEDLLAGWRPATGACRVLVTSRRQQWNPMLGVKTLPLDVLSPEESVALLHEQRPDLPEDDSDLNAIARELGGLPLALHLASSYLWRTRFDVKPREYLVRLRSPDLLQHPSLREARGISPTSHVQSVARTFMISYKRLDAADPTDRLAVALLARVAHFAPGEPIPRDLLRATLNMPGDDPETPLAGEALNRLAELGLLETDEEGALRMHRLVALFVRSEMARPESKATGEEAQVAVEEALANRLHSLVAKRHPAPLLAWIPHLRVVCDAARGREDKRAADLCNTLGYCLRMVGASSEARPLYERALAIREKVLGKEHPETQMLRENLRSLYNSQRF